jgi:hypothetical protein
MYSVGRFSPAGWKTGVGVHSGSKWEPEVKTVMRTYLAVLIGDENRLMNTAQVLTGDQIWEPNWLSHFEKGPIFMVKIEKLSNT